MKRIGSVRRRYYALRFIDIQNGTDKTAVRINIRNETATKNGILRVDPHPAWAPDYRYIAFNSYVNGTRRVFGANQRWHFAFVYYDTPFGVFCKPKSLLRMIKTQGILPAVFQNKK